MSFRTRVQKVLRGGDLPQGSPPSRAVIVSAKTAAYTLISEDSGNIFTNRAATGSVTFTLPASADNNGMYAYFYAIADFAIVVATATVDTMVIGTDDTGTGDGDLAADSFTFATSNEITGAACMAFCDGTGWCIMLMRAAGVTHAITT